MVATYSFRAKPVLQKSASWIAIVLLHLFLLLCLRQGRLHSRDDHRPAVYLDVSILPTLVKSTVLVSPASEPVPINKIVSISGKKELQLASHLSTVTAPVSENLANPVQTKAVTGSAPLDLEALRRRAVSDERKQRNVDPLLVPAQRAEELTLEEKFGKGVQNATRPNCVNAYQNGARIGNVTVAGLLVTGVIVADTLRDKGCKW